MATLRSWFTGIGRAAQSRIASQNATTWIGSSGVVGVPTSSRRPIGGFRGALTGFAIGFGAASCYGYIYLLKEYHQASTTMVSSVQELQDSTKQVTSAFARVSALEEQVQRVDLRASSKEEVLHRYSDLVRVYDALHEDVLEIRRKLYDIEQDYNQSVFAPSSRQANGRLV